MTYDDENKTWAEVLAEIVEETPGMEHLVAFQAERAAAYRRPIYPLRSVLAATSASESIIRNWLTRGRLELDANQERAEGGHRLFSERDVVLIALMHSLSTVGLPITEAAPIGDELMPKLDAIATRAMGIAGDPVVLLWKQDDTWKVQQAYDSRVGYLSSEPLPPTTITLRPLSILRRINDALREVEG